jgi:error-prone DNA polymerase
VNVSAWDNTLERKGSAPLALRLGFRKIDGFREEWGKTIAHTRTSGPFTDIETFARRTSLPRIALLKLADADSFRSLQLDRRQAMWAMRRLPDDAPLPLFAAAAARELGAEPESRLPSMALAEHVVADYQTLMLSLKAHPMSFLRDMFRCEGVKTCAESSGSTDGRWVKTAGLVLVRQRPGSAKGVVFMTIEDETGVTNAVIWPKVIETYRRQLMAASLILIEGRIQKSPEGVVHLVAVRLVDRTHDLSRLSEDGTARQQLTRADEIAYPQHPRTSNHPRNVRVIPKSRDFH